MNFLILLPWTTHFQHQNNQNQKSFQKKIFNNNFVFKLWFFTKEGGVFSRSQTPLYILIKRKQVKKLPQDYPSHGSPNNQKETKSHGEGSPCDSTINHKKQNHMVKVPHVIPQLITRNKITWWRFPMWFHN